MTEDLEKALKRELATAKAKPNPEERHEAILTAQANMLEALVECQRKTADRVKEIVAGANAAPRKLSYQSWGGTRTKEETTTTT
jgi:hypothetical protein